MPARSASAWSSPGPVYSWANFVDDGPDEDPFDIELHRELSRDWYDDWDGDWAGRARELLDYRAFWLRCFYKGYVDLFALDEKSDAIWAPLLLRNTTGDSLYLRLRAIHKIRQHWPARFWHILAAKNICLATPPPKTYIETLAAISGLKKIEDFGKKFYPWLRNHRAGARGGLERIEELAAGQKDVGIGELRAFKDACTDQSALTDSTIDTPESAPQEPVDTTAEGRLTRPAKGRANPANPAPIPRQTRARARKQPNDAPTAATTSTVAGKSTAPRTPARSPSPPSPENPRRFSGGPTSQLSHPQGDKSLTRSLWPLNTSTPVVTSPGDPSLQVLTSVWLTSRPPLTHAALRQGTEPFRGSQPGRTPIDRSLLDTYTTTPALPSSNESFLRSLRPHQPPSRSSHLGAPPLDPSFADSPPTLEDHFTPHTEDLTTAFDYAMTPANRRPPKRKLTDAEFDAEVEARGKDFRELYQKRLEATSRVEATRNEMLNELHRDKVRDDADVLAEYRASLDTIIARRDKTQVILDKKKATLEGYRGGKKRVEGLHSDDAQGPELIGVIVKTLSEGVEAGETEVDKLGRDIEAREGKLETAEREIEKKKEIEEREQEKREGHERLKRRLEKDLRECPKEGEEVRDGDGSGSGEGGSGSGSVNGLVNGNGAA